jgi:hypothetical protein
MMGSMYIVSSSFKYGMRHKYGLATKLLTTLDDRLGNPCIIARGKKDLFHILLLFGLASQLLTFDKGIGRQ